MDDEGYNWDKAKVRCNICNMDVMWNGIGKLIKGHVNSKAHHENLKREISANKRGRSLIVHGAVQQVKVVIDFFEKFVAVESAFRVFSDTGYIVIVRFFNQEDAHRFLHSDSNWFIDGQFVTLLPDEYTAGSKASNNQGGHGTESSHRIPDPPNIQNEDWSVAKNHQQYNDSHPSHYAPNSDLRKEPSRNDYQGQRYSDIPKHEKNTLHNEYRSVTLVEKKPEFPHYGSERSNKTNIKPYDSYRERNQDSNIREPSRNIHYEEDKYGDGRMRVDDRGNKPYDTEYSRSDSKPVGERLNPMSGRGFMPRDAKIDPSGRTPSHYRDTKPKNEPYGNPNQLPRDSSYIRPDTKPISDSRGDSYGNPHDPHYTRSDGKPMGDRRLDPDHVRNEMKPMANTRPGNPNHRPRNTNHARIEIKRTPMGCSDPRIESARIEIKQNESYDNPRDSYHSRTESKPFTDSRPDSYNNPTRMSHEYSYEETKQGDSSRSRAQYDMRHPDDNREPLDSYRMDTPRGRSQDAHFTRRETKPVHDERMDYTRREYARPMRDSKMDFDEPRAHMTNDTIRSSLNTRPSNENKMEYNENRRGAPRDFTHRNSEIIDERMDSGSRDRVPYNEREKHMGDHRMDRSNDRHSLDINSRRDPKVVDERNSRSRMVHDSHYPRMDTHRGHTSPPKHDYRAEERHRSDRRTTPDRFAERQRDKDIRTSSQPRRRSRSRSPVGRNNEYSHKTENQRDVSIAHSETKKRTLPKVDMSVFKGSVTNQFENFVTDIKSTISCAVIKNICQEIRVELSRKYQGIVVKPYGSMNLNIGIKGSPLDVCIYLPDNLKSKLLQKKSLCIEYLEIIKEMLQNKPIFDNVTFADDQSTVNFYCYGFDVRAGLLRDAMVLNDELFEIFISLDRRLVHVFMFIIYWSYFHNILQESIFEEHEMILLIIFYLQRLEKPILPPAHMIQVESEIQLDNKCLSYWHCNFKLNPRTFPKNENESDVLTLVEGFFRFYEKFDFKNNVISPFTGLSIPPEIFQDISKLPDEFKKYNYLVSNKYVYPLNIDSPVCIQDPIKLNRNATITITSKKLTQFVQECAFAYDIIYRARKNCAENDILKSLLSPRRNVMADIVDHTVNIKANISTRYPGNLREEDKSATFKRLIQLLDNILADVLRVKFNIENINYKGYKDLFIVYHCSQYYNVWSYRNRLKSKVPYTSSTLDYEKAMTDAMVEFTSPPNSPLLKFTVKGYLMKDVKDINVDIIFEQVDKKLMAGLVSFICPLIEYELKKISIL